MIPNLYSRESNTAGAASKHGAICVKKIGSHVMIMSYAPSSIGTQAKREEFNELYFRAKAKLLAARG